MNDVNFARRVGRGFTLIELLVVMSLISLLVSILLPALSHARKAAWSIRCGSQLRQVGLGAAMYFEDNRQRFHSRFFHYGHRNTEVNNPGIAQYVGYGSLGIRPTIFTCPTLQSVMPSLNWNRCSTYTSNQNNNYTFGHVKVSGVLKPSSTAYIFDGSGAFIPGQSWFYTDVTRGGSSSLVNLRYPHADANNTLYVDSHVTPRRHADFNVAGSNVFWDGN